MDTVQFVEAHATATRVGDAVEFSALNEAFKGVRSTIALGSIKSIIGHTGWAASAASVIKVCRAIQHKTIPPHANYSTPAPEIDLERSPFVIPTKPLAWPRAKTPRRAGVNGFGFGGTNGHAIIEEYDPDYHSRWRDVVPKPARSDAEIVVVGLGVARPQDGALRIDERNLKLPQGRRFLPEVLESIDPGQVMAIMAADQALACLGTRWPEWREDTGIILGFEAKTAGSNRMAGRIYLDRIKRRLAQELAQLGRSADEQRLLVERLERAICEQTRPSGRYTLPGVIPNLVTGRISNFFDLGGPNFIVDDAGASLLHAIRLASSQLQQGTCKVVLTGAVSANSSLGGELMASKEWRRGRPVGETAFVIALARADFARTASLEPIARLAFESGETAEQVRIGEGPAYLMGAEGAREIEGALAQLGGRKAAAAVSWRMPNGKVAGIRFSSARLQAAAIVHPAPAVVAAISDAVPIDYCTVDFQPAPAPPAVARTNLRQSKVLVICDQPQVLGGLNVPGWIYVAPCSLRIPGTHPIDLSSESEFRKSCGTLALEDLDALIAITRSPEGRSRRRWP